jgi:hypothetical protein
MCTSKSDFQFIQLVEQLLYIAEAEHVYWIFQQVRVWFDGLLHCDDIVEVGLKAFYNIYVSLHMDAWWELSDES